MMSVLQILDEIAATSSKLEKEAILRRNKDNTVLKDVIRYAYDPFVKFQIAKEVPYQSDSDGASLLEGLQAVVGNIASRAITGHAAIEFVSKVLRDLMPDDAVVLQRVILKDLRSGFSGSTANKVWKDLIPKFEVMLSHSDLKRITFPAYSQLKADGVRCHLIFNEHGKATAYSRSGKEIELLGNFDNIFYKRNMTLDGELVCYKNGAPLDRKTSNGIINKAIKGTISQEEAALICLCAWDIVDTSSTIPYNKRFGALYELMDQLTCDKIIVIPSKTVHSAEEAVAHFKEMRAAGNEGTLVKNMNHKWVPKRSYDLCKMKAVIAIEMKVVGIEEGTGKYEGMMGAIVVEDADGRIHCNVGTGFSDEERREGIEVGAIVTVEYNERITSRGRDTESLFLPRFVDLRLDRTTANTYNEIIQIEEATLK